MTEGSLNAKEGIASHLTVMASSSSNSLGSGRRSNTPTNGSYAGGMPSSTATDLRNWDDRGAPPPDRYGDVLPQRRMVGCIHVHVRHQPRSSQTAAYQSIAGSRGDSGEQSKGRLTYYVPIQHDALWTQLDTSRRNFTAVLHPVPPRA